MDKKTAHIYIIKLLTEELSTEENRLLQNWIKESDANQKFFDKIVNNHNIGADYATYKTIDNKAAYNNFLTQTGQNGKSIKLNTWLRYAAIIIALISFSIPVYKIYFHQETSIEPGKPQAILLSDDGTQVNLDSASTNSIFIDNHLIASASNGSINYNKRNQDISEVKFNTLIIPRGGEYKITLSDGTKVHLNADSKLTYPVKFTGATREVELSGEGFFEIAKDAKHPFYVNTNRIKIKQYGTAFNVYSRNDIEVKVALVHGSVSVLTEDNKNEYKLKPSQLAKYNSLSNQVNIETIDIEPYVAWHSGKFIFNDKALLEIMQTLSLWYDVDFSFQNPNIQEYKFTGNLSRSAPIETILKSIEFATDAHFTIKNNRVTINN